MKNNLADDLRQGGAEHEGEQKSPESGVRPASFESRVDVAAEAGDTEALFELADKTNAVANREIAGMADIAKPAVSEFPDLVQETQEVTAGATTRLEALKASIRANLAKRREDTVAAQIASEKVTPVVEPQKPFLLSALDKEWDVIDAKHEQEKELAKIDAGWDVPETALKEVPAEDASLEATPSLDAYELPTVGDDEELKLQNETPAAEAPDKPREIPDLIKLDIPAAGSFDNIESDPTRFDGVLAQKMEAKAKIEAAIAEAKTADPSYEPSVLEKAKLAVVDHELQSLNLLQERHALAAGLEESRKRLSETDASIIEIERKMGAGGESALEPEDLARYANLKRQRNTQEQGASRQRTRLLEIGTALVALDALMSRTKGDVAREEEAMAAEAEVPVPTPEAVAPEAMPKEAAESRVKAAKKTESPVDPREVTKTQEGLIIAGGVTFGVLSVVSRVWNYFTDPKKNWNDKFWGVFDWIGSWFDDKKKPQG